MKGWQIFRHSVRMVLNNFEDAMRVSGLLYLVVAATQVISFLNPPSEPTVEGFAMPDNIGLLVVLNIASLIATLWIPVVWHRYALLEEYPTGWIPNWHGEQVLAYFGRSIMIGVLAGLGVMMALIIPVALLAGSPQLAQSVGLALAFFIGGYLLLRMGVMLPATALGERLTLAETWNATKGESETIISLTFLLVALMLLTSVPNAMNAEPNSLVALIYNVAVGWFVTMITVSVLTSLYGHYVEGRPID